MGKHAATTAPTGTLPTPPMGRHAVGYLPPMQFATAAPLTAVSHVTGAYALTTEKD